MFAIASRLRLDLFSKNFPYLEKHEHCSHNNVAPLHKGNTGETKNPGRDDDPETYHQFSPLRCHVYHSKTAETRRQKIPPTIFDRGGIISLLYERPNERFRGR